MKIFRRITLIVAIAIFMLSVNVKSNAAEHITDLDNKSFYIKNSVTGEYLTIDGTSPQAGLNVVQHRWLNGSSRQKWYISYQGNNEYMICSWFGAETGSNGNTILYYALDVDDGINANGTNIHIWNSVLNGTTQTFSFYRTSDWLYEIETKCSNYQKLVSLSNTVCTNGVNIHQWEYTGSAHDQWILEPVDNTPALGVAYARANYRLRPSAFPDCDGIGGDCTNFVSQCLLAQGLHQNTTWYIHRKNLNYHTVNTREQLNDSWELADPSPWISAKEFKNYFSSAAPVYYTGQYILNHPDEIYNMDYYIGDVIQYAYNIVGVLGNGRHSMYVTSYTGGYVNGEHHSTFGLTGHTDNFADRDLLTIAGNHLGDYFVFYHFTNN